MRTTGDPLLLRPGIEREVKALVPTWPAFQFRTLDEGLQLQRLLPRLGATLLGVLGGFGLLLAAIGLYGVMAYLIRQRTREIGIRLALGFAGVQRPGSGDQAGHERLPDRRSDRHWRGAALDALLSSVLYGVSAADPLTYAAVPLLLLAVALLACYLPARHVTRVNTVEVLRHE